MQALRFQFLPTHVSDKLPFAMTTLVPLSFPAHELVMDIPRPSEVVQLDNGPRGYRWVMTETERDHIARMLDVHGIFLQHRLRSKAWLETTDSFANPFCIVPSAVPLRGNIMGQDRSVCLLCGKQSGLDDLVHNAVYAGIHSAPFMLDILQRGPKGPSPSHSLACSRCLTQFEGDFYWMPRIPWD